MTSNELRGESLAPAIRGLLARPLIQRRTDPDLFRAIAVCRAPLSRWFEDNLGWRLVVDLPGGFARLHKRAAILDSKRGLRRPRGARRPFDGFRYQLLALACAHLLRRPLITMGDLADAIARVMGSDEVFASFDATRQGHRLAFVDVLVWLRDHGAVECTAGEMEGFSAAERGDAVLKANTTIIPQLLSSDTPPSRIREDLVDQSARDDAAEWVERLAGEPRYALVADDPAGAERGLRVQWARHQVLRRLLDDPVLDLDALQPAVREYLQSAAGRDKVLDVVGEAGLSCERHRQVWLALDPTGESSDGPPLFSRRPSVTHQVAGIVLGVLVPTAPDGTRQPGARSLESLEAAVEDRMRRHPSWARGARKAGVAVTCAEALGLLESFGLVERDGDQVRPRPAAARFSFAQENRG